MKAYIAYLQLLWIQCGVPAQHSNTGSVSKGAKIMLPLAKSLCSFYKTKRMVMTGSMERWTPSIQDTGPNCSYVEMKGQVSSRKFIPIKKDCQPASTKNVPTSGEQATLCETLSPPSTRAGEPGEEKRWDRVIHYTIDPSSQQDYDAIRKAFDELEQKTCLRFRPLDLSVAPARDYIVFTRPGCVSDNGRIGGAQYVRIACPQTLDFWVPHHIMHILGFDHEIVRQDRDDWVKINFTNIRPAAYRFFEKRNNTRSFGTPYDYQSITHYIRNYHCIDCNYDTITPLRDTGGQPIGGQKLSYWDIEGLNRMYNCGSYGNYVQE